MIANITNYIMLLIFHDIRCFRSYASNISLSSIETVRLRSKLSKSLTPNSLSSVSLIHRCECSSFVETLLVT